MYKRLIKLIGYLAFWGTLIWIVSVPFVYSYAESIEFKGVQLRFYGVNKSQCIELVSSVLTDEQYFQKLHSISFFDRQCNAYYGLYYPPGVIYILNGCSSNWVLVHELAHHQQYIHGETAQQMRSHTGKFESYEKMIRRTAK